MDDDLEFLLNAPIHSTCRPLALTPAPVNVHSTPPPNKKPRQSPLPPAANTESLVSAEYFTSLEIAKDVADLLHPYQKEGVQWLLHQHKDFKGCLLADEMGLGKTVQVTVFLAEMLRLGVIRTVLIVVPPTLISVWADAFKKWSSGGSTDGTFTVEVVDGETKRPAREKHWAKLGFRVGRCVLLTTYGVMKRDVALIARQKLDYVVLDEAHCIKDPSTAVSKASLELKAHHKIAVTGTPLMNNFQDLWSIFEFLDDAVLDMPQAEFQRLNAQLLRSNERDAAREEREVGARRLEQFKDKVSRNFLRREKRTVAKELASRKTDVVVWVTLSEVQKQQYLEFLASDVVHVALKEINVRQPLALLTALKNITNHPWLNFTNDNFRNAMALDDHTAGVLQGLPEFGSLLSGTKLSVAMSLIDHHRAEGCKTLVFSRSKRMLDMLSVMISSKGFGHCRVDGDVPNAKRMSIVKEFNSDPAVSVCLLTTQVGGVGLTLTGASRVILLDPSWNPALDSQAVDRAHRIGQQRDVVVVRLIAAGTVDEKVYRNQLFKLTAANQLHTTAATAAYFTKTQLRNMFALDDTQSSETASQLNTIHGQTVDRALRTNLMALDGVVAVSDHLAVFGDVVDESLLGCNESEGCGKRPSPPPRAKAHRGLVAPPTSTLSELAAQLDDLEALEFSQGLSMWSDTLTPSGDVPAIPRGRCSIFEQGASIEALVLGDLRQTHFVFRGVAIRRLPLDEIEREARRSEVITEFLGDGWLLSDTDDCADSNTHEPSFDLSPGGGLGHVSGPNWEELDRCESGRPSLAQRRRAAATLLQHATVSACCAESPQQGSPLRSRQRGSVSWDIGLGEE